MSDAPISPPAHARLLWQHRCEVLHEGEACGRGAKLTEPLSFWGGFDPNDGRIIDRHHEQYGRLLGGRILVLPTTRGSAGTPAGLAESLRSGHGPAGIVLGRRDVNLMVGAAVATRLYALAMPVVVIDTNRYDRLEDDQWITIKTDGTLTAFAASDSSR